MRIFYSKSVIFYFEIMDFEIEKIIFKFQY